MHHTPLLQDFVILLGFSILIVFLLQRLKLPSILGFLVTGIVIGPHGLSLIGASDQIEVISEIGVILLLFVIGMELSLKQLASIKNTVFIGGSLQVGLTILISGFAYYFLGNSIEEAVFVGFLFSLSSTAIVLKILQDRNEMKTAHGRNALAILIFQDIIVVPMMLITPILAGTSENVGMSIVMLVVKSIIVVIITIVSARYIVPKLMYAVAKTKSQELFLLTTIAICFAVAFLTSEAGLSLALGAFLAGLIISESEYSHQATSIILPFRELFTSIFFISIGMLLDLSFFIGHIGIILLLVLTVFLIKTLATSIAVAVLKYPPKAVVLTGLSLFQIGEFAFILSTIGIEHGLLSEETNQYFLSVSIVSMILTPFVIMFSHTIADKFLNTKLGRKIDNTLPNTTENDDVMDKEIHNHLIIIGYGINGSNLAKAAQYADIPYVVIEMNPTIVKSAKDDGIPILFGDASQPHILDTVNLSRARSVVIAISDKEATKTVIRNIRDTSQTVHILVRTRYVREISELIALGADDVIPEEFETSIEIFSRVMHNFLVPESQIDNLIEYVRSDNYEVFQMKKKVPKTFTPTSIPDFSITCVRVTSDSSKINGRSLKEANIRAKYGISVLAVSHKDKIIDDIHPDQKIYQNDLLYVQGSSENIEEFRKFVN
ncbi:monovalent cation:proton antiporter-2 (CPA2) family protein [Aureibaculum sp. 2210JD6-5]|uniref:monovalent cation:proton antiporter-2 (CPA2) family protein n=1 Tax=Aureibaculum sp. 2210JD6-5 TaxID=3103957 RepID=UPI002AAC4F2C|nr:monovalent cation:proton antiporter-2 (CPA2) family protein [Aureibaculum sp. 2210JD6-5]MDY7394858.1 monovalent cation:proton antiporter-2 (CPA2) family protein [Aureibaculum sp. 2210JD6-5]